MSDCVVLSGRYCDTAILVGGLFMYVCFSLWIGRFQGIPGISIYKLQLIQVQLALFIFSAQHTITALSLHVIV